MQHIEIPDDQFAKLTERALAAGYENISAFIGALAAEPKDDPWGPLSEEELRIGAAECTRINEGLKAGAGRDAREALTELGEEFGLKPPQ